MARHSAVTASGTTVRSLPWLRQLYSGIPYVAWNVCRVITGNRVWSAGGGARGEGRPTGRAPVTALTTTFPARASGRSCSSGEADANGRAEHRPRPRVEGVQAVGVRRAQPTGRYSGRVERAELGGPGGRPGRGPAQAPVELVAPRQFLGWGGIEEVGHAVGSEEVVGGELLAGLPVRAEVGAAPAPAAEHPDGPVVGEGGGQLEGG